MVLVRRFTEVSANTPEMSEKLCMPEIESPQEKDPPPRPVRPETMH